MSNAIHYTTLGLIPSAAPEVVRAAYKALALVCHPDKTMHLTAAERASHAAVFKDVQAAYDVLGNPSLKAAYDAELKRNATEGDSRFSTFHHHSPVRTSSDASPTPKRRATVKMTTPEQKRAMRAEARQSLDYLRTKRTERAMTDAQMDVAGLKDMAHTWRLLAEENRSDPVMHAHCAIRIHEYEQKVAECERQHGEWLANLSTAKQEISTPITQQRRTTVDAPKKPATFTSGATAQRTSAARPRLHATSPTAPVHGAVWAEERKRAEAERSIAAAARAEARQAERAQREAAKQSQLDQKAAAVRAEKEKRKAKAALHAQKDADRIAKARAKAGAAPLENVGAVVDAEPNDGTQASTSVVENTAPQKARSTMQRICSKCGIGHTSFREWLKCNAPAKSASDEGNEAYLRTV
jgi:curved DNA-binding protein CbpA